MTNKIYSIELMQEVPNGDLYNWEREILWTLDYLENGGKTGTKFTDLVEIEKVSIHEDKLILHVEEVGTDWHRFLGKLLVSKFSMREFCLETDLSRMFRWREIRFELE